MAFSEIFGLAGSVLGFMGAREQAQRQERIAMEELGLKREALKMQKNQSDLQYGMARDEQRRLIEQEQYLRDSNARNSRMWVEEYDLRLQGQRDRLRMALGERDYMLDRQSTVDAAAAREREFRLSQLFTHRATFSDERDFGIDELRRAQETAARERRFDETDYGAQKDQLSDERTFSVAELRRAQDIAASERASDLALRARTLRATDAFAEAMDSVSASLGPLDAPGAISSADIASATDRATSLALADVDRAAAIAGGTASRAAAGAGTDVRARISDEYRKARTRGRDEAMDALSGKRAIARTDFANGLTGRSQALAEVSQAKAAPIEVLNRLPRMAPANDYRAPVPIGTALVLRPLVSANNYRTPTDIRSGTYDRLDPGPGLGPTLEPDRPSRFAALDPGSRLMQQQMWATPNPQGWAGMANGLLQSYTGGFNPEPYWGRAVEAGKSGGAALASGIRSAGRLFDGMGGSFGGSLFGTPGR